MTAAPSGYSTLSAQLPPCSATLVVGAAPDPAFIQASDTAPEPTAPRSTTRPPAAAWWRAAPPAPSTICVCRSATACRLRS
ncbi:hypothetical protein LP420_32685 [Massilia sp. B-10]|nr:hypothetical protein LP420_32685 [Massilia sp. B-10]